METKEIEYACGQTSFKGYAAWEDDKSGTRPGILIAHAWRGRDEFSKQKALDLAQLGYVALAADVYGEGITAENNDDAAALMRPLFLDRKLLQDRIKSAYEALRKHPLVNPQKIGGIGYCFGGLTIIELYRSGVELKGAVSFHAVLGTSLGGQTAKTVPISPSVKGSLLILHGHDDPLVSQEDLIRIQDELTKANVDWQLHIYGRTKHAFTNPEANDSKMGLVYNAQADKRSWQTMKTFFNEIFI